MHRYQTSQGVPAAIHATCAAGGVPDAPKSGSNRPHSGDACPMVSYRRNVFYKSPSQLFALFDVR